LTNVPKIGIDAANYFSSVIVPDMDAVRAEADALELLTDKSYWPFPTYSDLLFY
jgi:glutamine synthetase